MNFYHVVYLTSAGLNAEMFVVASTPDNAWAAAQAQDPKAATLQGVDEQVQGVVVGS